MTADFTILSGTAHPALAQAVARELGVVPGACALKRFPDGEVSVRLLEAVRGREVVLLQPTPPPVDPHLMELLATADACRRAAALRVTAVVPYLGYARADKRGGVRGPITARVVADLLEAVGIGHVVLVDPHTPQIEGFFHAPVDTLTAEEPLVRALRDRLPAGAVVVSPDEGRIGMASRFAQDLGVSLAVCHKRREGPGETRVVRVVGEVAKRPCLIVDDMIATGSTIAGAVGALLAAGARPEIFVAATHGLFLPGAREALELPAVREVWVSDTIPPVPRGWPQLRVASVAALLADALRRFLGGRP